MTVNNRKFLVIRAALIAAAIAIPAVAQSGGLPGGHLITDRWRSVYSTYSGITNPAFINGENYMAPRYLFTKTLESFYTQEAGFTMPLGLYDAAGVAWIMNGVSPFEATNPDGTPTGQKITDQGHFIALTYARNVWAGLTVGGNANIIAQNIADIPAEDKVGNAMRFGFGMDFGLTYKALRHQLLGNHILGVSTNNIFNMITGTDEKYAAALRFSLLSDFCKKRIYYGADFVMKDILNSAGDWDSDPSKVVKGMPWEFTQKVGANILRIFKLYLLVGFNNESLDHYGFAFGARSSLGILRNIEVMAQFVSITNPSSAAEANASHITFYARTEFGKHREEVFADK
jgi:hypothetical protein